MCPTIDLADVVARDLRAAGEGDIVVSLVTSDLLTAETAA